MDCIENNLEKMIQDGKEDGITALVYAFKEGFSEAQEDLSDYDNLIQLMEDYKLEGSFDQCVRAESDLESRKKPEDIQKMYLVHHKKLLERVDKVILDYAKVLAQKQKPPSPARSSTAGQQQGAAKAPEGASSPGSRDQQQRSRASKRQGGGGPAIQKAQQDQIEGSIREFLKKANTILDSVKTNLGEMKRSYNKEVDLLMHWLRYVPDGLHDVKTDEDHDYDKIQDFLKTYELKDLFDECIELDKKISDALRLSDNQVTKYKQKYMPYMDKMGKIYEDMEPIQQQIKKEQEDQLLRYNAGKKKWSFPNFQQRGEDDSQIVNVPEDLKEFFTRDPSRKHGHLNERYIVNREKLKDRGQITIAGYPYNIQSTKDKITFISEDQTISTTKKCFRDPNDYLSLTDFCRLLRIQMHFPRSEEPFVWTRFNNCVENRSNNARFMVNLSSTSLYNLPSCYKLRATDISKRDKEGTIINSFKELVDWFGRTGRIKYKLAFVCPTIRKSRTIQPSENDDKAVYTDQDGLNISLPIFIIEVKDYQELMYNQG